MVEPQKALESAICPNCGLGASLKEIIWGMPEAGLDMERFEIGGCCIPESPAELACKHCGWRGSYAESK